ncbi:MAG: hypothetical protein WBZ36_24480 [Candidatus Nitrosopolaris sp.]
MKTESRIIVSVFVFAFITSALALVTVMISKYIALNIFPSPIDAAKALRHKSSHYFSSLPSARRGNISPFFSQPIPTNINPLTHVPEKVLEYI